MVKWFIFSRQIDPLLPHLWALPLLSVDPTRRRRRGNDTELWVITHCHFVSVVPYHCDILWVVPYHFVVIYYQLYHTIATYYEVAVWDSFVSSLSCFTIALDHTDSIFTRTQEHLLSCSSDLYKNTRTSSRWVGLLDLPYCSSDKTQSLLC